jgi:UDP-glucose 4-epimerase
MVAGAAGYIGSHAVVALQKRRHEVDNVDDLSTGWRPAYDDLRTIVATAMSWQRSLKGRQSNDPVKQGCFPTYYRRWKQRNSIASK